MVKPRKKEKPKLERKQFAASSEKQRMVLQENGVDILLTGGGKLVPPR